MSYLKAYTKHARYLMALFPSFTDSLQNTRVAMAKKKLDDRNNQNDDNPKTDSDVNMNDDEPNFSDPEGYVDNVTDEGIYELFAYERLRLWHGTHMSIYQELTYSNK